MAKLVTYFSVGGTTREKAECLAKLLDADLFEIEAAEPYTKEDLNWSDKNSRTTVEAHDDSARPELKEKGDVTRYDTVLIGFPVWWRKEPRIIDTFLEAHDFTDKKLLAFVTSDGPVLDQGQGRKPTAEIFGHLMAGIERSEGLGPIDDGLRALAPKANWIPGIALDGKTTEEDLRKKLELLGI